MLVVCCRHDSELLAENDDTAADSNENLAHDEVSDAGVGVAEVDHETLSKEVYRHGNEQ